MLFRSVIPRYEEVRVLVGIGTIISIVFVLCVEGSKGRVVTNLVEAVPVIVLVTGIMIPPYESIDP